MFFKYIKLKDDSNKGHSINKKIYEPFRSTRIISEIQINFHRIFWTIFSKSVSIFRFAE